MEIVAEYQGRLTPDLFSRLLFDAGSEYNTGMVVVENNSVGFTVLDKLKDMEYPNVYHSIKSTHEYVDEYTAETMSNSVAGFTTSQKTRPLIVAKMEEFIRNKLIKINSVRLLSEMKTFVWNHGKAQAMRSYNDDLVMACAVGCWVRDTALVANKRDIEYNKVFLDSMVKNKTTLNTTIPGMIGYNNQNKQKREAAKVMTDFPWLFKG